MPHLISKTLHRRAAALLIAFATAAVPALSLVTPAHADLGSAVRASVPSAELVGEGRLRILGFRVFDAKLYAPDGEFDPNNAFALELTYLRSFSGDAIANETIKEIKRQGYRDSARLNAWGQTLESLFPDVKPGQSITGVRTPSGGTVFYFGNRNIGTINDREFTDLFFNIWLGTDTRNPGLRAQLVGAAS